MDVKLPKLGEGAETGVVVSLLVKEGERVTAGQTLLELENEKAVAPIPSPAAGEVSHLRVKEGDRISVGQSLLVLVVEGKAPAGDAVDAKTGSGAAAGAKSRQAERRPTATSEDPGAGDGAVAEAAAGPGESAASQAGLPPAASPSIRKLARELGIDLKRIRGSEAGGRIVLGDLRSYLERLQTLAFAPQPAPQKAADAPASPPSIDFSKWGTVARKPLTSLRKIISQRMTDSWRAIPRVTQFDEADITALLELRKKFGPAYEAQGARLTLTSFALKAVVAALQKHPIFNSTLDETAGEIVFKAYHHIGIAVDTDAGLMVPVIRDADKKDLITLSKELGELAVKARDRKVSLDDLKGGTFTISNQGAIGGAHFTPIVNHPEVAILGLGRGAVKAVVKHGQIVARTLLPLAVSYDHRVIDGATAARFCVDLVQALENFPEMEVRV